MFPGGTALYSSKKLDWITLVEILDGKGKDLME
jgi:hypothetical protein